MMDGNQDMTTQSLITAKARRAAAITAAAEGEIRAAADAADLLACEAHLITLGRSRAAAIAAAKPTAVIAVDAELLRASVVREIAAARSVASTAKHATAVAELHQSEAAVAEAAKTVLNVEMVALAGEVEVMREDYLASGERLRELAAGDGKAVGMGSGPTLPREVVRALERLPKRNDLETPIHILRNGPGSSGIWKRRLAELMHDSIDVGVAA